MDLVGSMKIYDFVEHYHHMQGELPFNWIKEGVRDRRHLTDVATQSERRRRLAVTWRGRIKGWNRLGRLNNESGVAERKGGG